MTGKNWFSRRIMQVFGIKFPCGKTVREVKRLLETTTHCGVYWEIEARYSAKTNVVYVEMEGNEFVSFHMETGKRTRIDYD